jgi:uncharacterized oligopeptide transporter (OPT) family protein
MIERDFTLRSLLIGLLFGSLIAVANALLSLTIPMLLTASMISVVALFAYSSFFRAASPTPREAVTAYTTHQAAALAFSIFPIVWVLILSVGATRTYNLGIPDWILPNSTLYGDVYGERMIFSSSWINPLAWMIPVAIVSGLAALILVIWLKDHFITKKDLPFPEAEADIQFIKSLSTEKFRFDYLFYGLLIGFFFDFLLIHYPISLGTSPQWLVTISSQLRLIDFTPYLASLLPGVTFCVTIMMGFIGLGMLMSPKSTFNMMGSALAFYGVLSLILVSRGTIEAANTFSGQWSNFRYPFGLSLSVGILLTAAAGPVLLKIASPLISGEKWKWKPSYKTILAFGIFCLAVFILTYILSMDRFVTIFPLTGRKSLLVGLVMIGTFILGILVTMRIAGEAGIMWLGQFSDITDYLRRGILTAIGALGFEGFAISESLRGPRFAAGQLQALKVGQAFKATPRHQYLSALIGWCFGWLISTPFVFLIWHFYSFGDPSLPMPNVQAMANVIVGFSIGQMTEVFNNWYILTGFIIGIVILVLQKQNLPFVVTAVGIGVFAGPIYVSTFFIGGLLRALVEKIKGSSWFDEKGKPFSAGIVLGGLALAPLFMVIVNVLVAALGGG